MKKILNKDNCYFTHSKVIELLTLVIDVFLKDSKVKYYDSLYTEEYIENIRNKYRFLGEIIPESQNQGMSILEFLLWGGSYDSLEEYKAYLLEKSDLEFFYELYGKYIAIETLEKALHSEEGLSQLYNDFGNISNSYLALKGLFTNRTLFINQFFQCAEELDTEEFNKFLCENEALIAEEERSFTEKLWKNEPFEITEMLLGKVCKNRGPYEKFIFVPSFFMPFRIIRYFDEHQILIYSLKHKQLSKNDITKILKVISDDSRFNIIDLLSTRDPMMGKELASALGIATSTLSHHIEQLKEIGFINEERVKNSKYYSLNSNSMNKFLEYFSNKFSTKK